MQLKHVIVGWLFSILLLIRIWNKNRIHNLQHFKFSTHIKLAFKGFHFVLLCTVQKWVGGSFITLNHLYDFCWLYNCTACPLCWTFRMNVGYPQLYIKWVKLPWTVSPKMSHVFSFETVMSSTCAENGNIFPAAFSLYFLLIYEIN